MYMTRNTVSRVNRHLPVIPIEMEGTDLISLRENYQGILSPVKYNDTDQLDKLVLRYLPQNPLNHSKADESSYQEMEHRYLVGLAYLYGIEVQLTCYRSMLAKTHTIFLVFPTLFVGMPI